MQRVMVIGGSGAGKSTFARELADLLGVPAVHMDRLFWEPGWVVAEEDVFLARVHAEIAKDAWVMDGTYSRTWPARLERTDTVIFLDLPTWLRFWRAFMRTLSGYGKTRADLAEDCPERFDLSFLFGWVIGYRWRSRHKALSLMADDGPAAHCTRYQLTTRRAVQRFLDSVAQQDGAEVTA